MNDDTVRVLESELRDAKKLIYLLIGKLGGDVTIDHRDFTSVPNDAELRRDVFAGSSKFSINADLTGRSDSDVQSEDLLS